ncbi:hypothetical protein EV363DRAFT_1330720 [Boletus edulis]|nr:hypothetical protein EV363DRAFT_1330720 [Boletus edulis]
MSLIPPGTAPSFDITLYASVQVAMKPPSLVTVLYVIARYLGDVVLMYVVAFELCFSVSESEEFRAWGALAYSWATQATMQLRIYAMYGRSRRTLVMMVTSFLCEVAAIAFIIWRTIGPDSSLKGHFCAFSGIHANFVYIFIPFLCFESFLFLLAARAFFKSTKRIWKAGICDEKILGVNTSSESFMCILARDSLCYFFVDRLMLTVGVGILIACAVVMGLWQSVLYANMCIPFVMLLEVLVGTRLILDFRERYARQDDVLSGRCSSLYFRDDIQLDIIYKPERCEVETIVVTDAIV